MKYLLAFLFSIFLSFNVNANRTDFNLNIERLDNGKETIRFVPDSWEYITKSTSYTVSVEKGALRTEQDNVEFHSVTIYNEPHLFETIGSLIDKIYTYGILSCTEKTLFIFNEVYVDSKEIIVFNSMHQFGSYTVELQTPNTPRNDIFKAVCNLSI